MSSVSIKKLYAKLKSLTYTVYLVAMIKGKIAPVNIGADMTIKWRLAVLMADREINYKELAKLVGFNPVTVSKHKNSRVMPARLEHDTLDKYCKALQCQPGELLVYIPDEPNDEL